MSVKSNLEASYSVRQSSGNFVTRRGIAIALFTALAATLGLMTLVVPPIILAAAVIGVLVAILIAIYPYFGLLVFYAVVVVKPEELWPQIAVVHPLRMIALLLLASTILHKKLTGEKFVFMSDNMIRILGVFALTLFASVPMAYWPTNSFMFALDFLWILVYYLILVNLLTTERRLRGFVWLVMLAAGYSAISSAIAYFAGSTVVAQGIERAEGLAGVDPNTLAVNILLAIPFLFLSLNWIKNNLMKLAPLAFLIASVVTIAITGSRSGFIGLVVTGFLIWLVSRHKIVSAAIAVLLLIAGWFALPAQYKDRYSTILSTERDASSVGRIEAWKAGWAMFMANPVTGVGVDCFPLAYGSGEYSDTRAYLRPHSLYVQLISELGLVGFLAFGALVWYILRMNVRLRKRLMKAGYSEHFYIWVSYGITCSMAALFVTSVFGHSLFRVHWYLCAALTVALQQLTERLLKGNLNSEAANTTGRVFGPTY